VGLVVINTAVVLIFAASFFHPHSKRDWRAFGLFSGFIVALFTEMYGVPLTVYLLSSWLGNNALGLNLTHNGGHLWTDLIGWRGDPHVSPFHIASYIAIGGGFWLMAAAWRVLYTAKRAGELATNGAYAAIRHPQYTGFFLIMVGFLLQWPTLPTLLMFPVLLVVYRKLALHEEAEVRAEFGSDYEDYAARTPRFVPGWGRRGGTGVSSAQGSAPQPSRPGGKRRQQARAC
jgi:protein-S-isoprenylcysteine O-methyltransferase Ste14